MRRVLELPAFRRLLAAWILNELGLSIGAVALALLVYRRTGSALGATAFFLCAEFAPAFTSPFFVSRLYERTPARVLSGLYGAEAVIFVALAWLTGQFALIPILALTLLDGTLGVSARVLGRAAWTRITADAGLMREGSSIMSTSLSVCYMVGPAVGGAVVSAGGTRAALLVNVALFGLMSITLITARGIQVRTLEPGQATARLRAAIRYAWSQVVIRQLIGLQAVAMLFFATSIPVEVILAHKLHAGAGGYGVLLSGWGGGAIVGSAIYARWRRRSFRALISVGTGLLGVGLLVMAVAPTIAVAVAGAAIAGFGNGIQAVAMRTALQEAVPEGWMALILSLNESVFQAIPGLGIVFGGAVAALAGPRIALATGAAGSCLVAVVMWLKLAVTTGRIEEQAEVETPSAPGPALSAATKRP